MIGYITKTCNIVLIPYSALTLQKEHLSVSDESSFIWQSVTKCTAINMRFNYFSRTFWLLRNKISIFQSFIDYHTQYYRKNIRNAAKNHCIYVLIERNMDIDILLIVENKFVLLKWSLIDTYFSSIEFIRSVG